MKERSSKTKGRPDRSRVGSDRLHLTPAGLKLLAGALVVAVLGTILGVTEAYAASVGLLVILLYSVARASMWQPLMQVERQVVPRRVNVGDTQSVELRIQNRSRRTSPPVRVTDHVETIGIATVAVAPIEPVSAEHLTFTLPTHTRGISSIGPCRYSLVDPFRLVQRDVVCSDVEEIVVWPARWDLALPPEARPGGSDLRQRSGHQWANTAGEFATLADYVPGDDRRHIHWPSTARAGRLIVRRFEPPNRSNIWLVLDRIPSSPLAFEVAVSLTTSLVFSEFDSGPRLNLRFWGPTGLTGHSDGADSNTGRWTDAFVPKDGSFSDILDALAVTSALEHPDDSTAQEPSLESLRHQLGADQFDTIVVITSRSSTELPWTQYVGLNDLLTSGVVRVPATTSVESLNQSAAQELVNQAFVNSEHLAGSVRSQNPTHSRLRQ